MSSGFISESKLEEKRRLRQEEWEKVRKPEDPCEAPEEEYDSRSLFDRLKEQKDKKQADWDEAHKLKNLVRGLDDDEAGFLDFVDQTKLAEESRILQEEREELEDYRKAVAKENEERLRTGIKSNSMTVIPTRSGHSVLPSIGVSKESQKSKLNACVVKRKNVTSTFEANTSKKQKTDTPVDVEILPSNNLKCIAILPGIGCYEESSDRDSSNESDKADEDEKKQFDLCGRPIS